LKNAQRSDICSVEIAGTLSTLKFNIELLSPKIDIICFQNLGSFGVRLPNFGTDMSHCRVFGPRLILVLRIFSAAIFTIRPHLDHSHKQKPQNTRYQNSNLAPLVNVGIGRFWGVFQEESVFNKGCIWKRLPNRWLLMTLCFCLNEKCT